MRLASFRRLLLGIFVLGALGLIAELVLLQHWDDAWQAIPLVLLVLSLFTLGWYARRPSSVVLRIFQALTTLFLVGGVAGVLLHYRGDVEWKLEGDPTLHGWALFVEALHGAIPLLAPGAMMQLGLLGLLWTFRHPVLRSSRVGAGTQFEE